MLKRSNDRVPPGVRGEIVRIPVLMIQVPSRKATVTIVAQPEVAKPRLEGRMIEIKFNVTIVKDGAHVQ